MGALFIIEIVEHIEFDGFNTRTEGLYLLERDAPSAQEYEILETVPYMNGVYDFSFILGGRKFKNRKLTYKFWVPDVAYVYRKEIENHFKNMLMQKAIHPLRDTHERGQGYWLGKCVSVKADDDARKKQITLTLEFDCYPYWIMDTAFHYEEWDVFDFNKGVAQFLGYRIQQKLAILLINNGDTLVYPDITVSNDMQILLNGESYYLVKDSYNEAVLPLVCGENRLQVIGTGEIRFGLKQEVMY